MALASGTRLGPYEILSALGAGGMGEVYRARDAKLGRDVALKILPDTVAEDADRIARFKREAQVLASLNHPNIAAIYGFEDSGDVHALVLELVEGPTLADRIARGPIPIDEALPIAKQIAEALEGAHDHGIIHRDLKPANIKVRPDGTVKVLDFGLAKALDPVGSAPDLSTSPTITSPAMTEVGVILGTVAYMSPEQARGKTVDKRADIWAFGCVVYEMLTGQRAFGGEDVADVLSRVLQREPDFGVLPPSVPARVTQALRVCLRKDPKQRVADIRDVRLVLKGAFEVATPQMTAIATSSAARGHIVWTVAMAAVLVALGYLYLHKTASTFLPAQFELQTPPTSEPLSFALSPDGRQLTFVAMDGATSRLWIRPLNQLTARPLAGTEGASYPFWAPDARAIAFFADGKLKRLQLGSGAAQDVADAPSGRGGTWNQDGVILFAPTTAGTLMRVPATGGTPAPATHFASGQKSHRWPQFLPDGHHFLFLSTQGEPGTQGIFVGTLDNEATTRVLEDESAAIYAEPDTLLFVRRGSLVAMEFDPATGSVSGDPKTLVQPIGFDPSLEQGAVAVSRAGVLAHRTAIAGPRQLVWVDRAGTERGTVGPVDEQAMAAPELTRDGRRVTVFRTLDGKGDVWIIDVGRSVPSRFTSDGMFNAYPVWSPDGRQIVFTSMRQGTNELVERPTDMPGGNRSLLGHADVRVANDFSPDGRFLLFAVQVPQTGVDLWALPRIGGSPPFPVAQTPFDEMAGQFSPDGGEVAFQSNESGRMEVYAVSFPRPGPRVQLSSSGGSQPRWSHDGRELFYVSTDGRMMAVPIRAGSAGRLVDPGQPIALFPTHLATGANIPPAVGSRAQYAVAPDGRFLMNVSVESAAAPPITIVLNWRAALEK